MKGVTKLRPYQTELMEYGNYRTGPNYERIYACTFCGGKVKDELSDDGWGYSKRCYCQDCRKELVIVMGEENDE